MLVLAVDKIGLSAVLQYEFARNTVCYLNFFFLAFCCALITGFFLVFLVFLGR